MSKISVGLSPYATIIAMAMFDSLVQFLLDNSVVIGTPIEQIKTPSQKTRGFIVFISPPLWEGLPYAAIMFTTLA